MMLPNDVRQLPWTHDHERPPGGRDLLPGVPQWVDVAFTVNGASVLFVPSHPEWHTDELGYFIFTVQISADGADPVSIQVRVHWDGRYESLRGQQVRPSNRFRTQPQTNEPWRTTPAPTSIK